MRIGRGCGFFELRKRRLLRGRGIRLALRLVLVRTEIVDDLRHGVADAPHELLVEPIALGVRLREPQPFEQDFIVVRDERFLP